MNRKMYTFNESELRTRKDKIDVLLKEHGWDVEDKSKVLIEIDTKQSDFNKKDYKNVSETLKNEEESKYADYVLRDKKGYPLAIIEAKRTSKDPIIGKRQAREYAEDIKEQTGNPVFIFLTNGYEIWFWNYPYENPRMVKGFHDQDSLERLRWTNENKREINEININSKIIDRPYQIEAVKRVCEGIKKGNRKFLMVQATGTGKTRVCMALADRLMKANIVKKVLFLADRKALRDQAYNDGFKVFFPNESKLKVYSGKADKTAKLYASTIQTFMEFYQDFSPGDFDLIISDECHRSIYNKWKDVFTYFDAIQIGLTATPAEMVDRDTFRFFECEDSTPSYLYSYDQAVKEGWLVDFKVQSASTHFQIEGIRPKDIPENIKDKLSEEGILEDSLFFEGTEIEKKVIVTGTNEAIVKEFMDNCLMDQTGTLPAKSIIFAISKKHATRIYKAFEKLYPEYKGKLVEIITSDDPKAQKTLDDFKKLDFPRVTISVDMLDTGVDIPEVCNLVFAKPVFSKIKFWQMIGRGTRNNAVCKHKEWLPNGKKEFFLIFDFWKNMSYFDMHPEGRESKSGEALTSKIFLIRLQLYDLFLKNKNSKYAGLLKKKIIDDINSLPKKTVSIRENEREINLVLSGDLWKKVGYTTLEFLRTKMAPLMKFKQDVNLNIASFTLKIERLGFAVLNKDKETIDRLREDICEAINCLPHTITKVKEKEQLLNKITDPFFWSKISYEDVLTIIDEVAPLMIYKRSEPVPKIILDIEDIVQQRKIIEFGPIEKPKQEYVEVYKNKVEKKILKLAEDHPTIKKIKKDQALTENDLEKLEKTLNSPQLYITEDTLKKVYEKHEGTLVEFIKKVLGMYKFPDAKEKIEEAFKTFIVEVDSKLHLNADQINFLRALQTVFSTKHHIAYRDFFEPPFTNIEHAPLPLFKKEQLYDMLTFCNKTELSVFNR